MHQPHYKLISTYHHNQYKRVTTAFIVITIVHFRIKVTLHRNRLQHHRCIIAINIVINIFIRIAHSTNITSSSPLTSTTYKHHAFSQHSHHSASWHHEENYTRNQTRVPYWTHCHIKYTQWLRVKALLILSQQRHHCNILSMMSVNIRNIPSLTSLPKVPFLFALSDVSNRTRQHNPHNSLLINSSWSMKHSDQCNASYQVSRKETITHTQTSSLPLSRILAN